MTASRSTLLLFGDQTAQIGHTIKRLYRQSRRSILLQTLFQKTTDALQCQTSKLQPFERQRFFSFESILGLAETYAETGVLDIAVSTVLLCIAQLGSLIIHAENNSHILGTGSSSEVFLLGLCTGLLPAAAVAAAASVTELLEVAPELVCVSLRVGIEANHRSMQLEQSKESWATFVTGIPVNEQQKELDIFHASHIIPLNNKAYISAESDSSATISGPPSTLELLFSFSDRLSRASKSKLPISAAFHASHLSEPDVDRMIGPSLLFDKLLRRDTRLISTSSGKPYVANNIRELLHHAIIDILRDRLNWAKVIQGIVSSLSDKEITLTAVGPTNATNSLRRALRIANIKVTETGRVEPSPTIQSQRGGSGAIAIVGMSGRFPGSESLEELWSVLEDGLDLHQQVPKDRFDVETHCDPSGKIENTTLTPYGCFINRPGFFDRRLFNMSPREAAQTDPGQRLLLMTTYEALEMAGYHPDTSPSTNRRRIGTFFGQTIDDWREHNASQNIDMYYVTGGIRAFGPGRINYHFKWEGPSISLDTACSSSAVAIQLACSALLSRDCDTAVAGGTNILTGVDMFAGLSRGSFLSTTGSCKTFDKNADGYCRGDGVGSIILKRLEDAVADRDNIQAVITAASTNHSAQAISITHPHAETQQRLFQQVLQDACVEPDQVDYVEMHGTGTQAGDGAEFMSVTNIFAKDRKSDVPLYIGSVKPNLGHGEAAAGVTAVIKSILMLRKNVIPPHIGIKGHINEKLSSLDKLNVCIANTPTDFRTRPGGDGKRRIVLNSFSAAGGNTSLLLESPPERSVEGEDPRSTQVVSISARTSKSLMQNMRRLLNYLNINQQTQLADLSYTTTARRMHHEFRQAYAVQSTAELKSLYEKALANLDERKPTSKSSRMVYVFTGQGSQYLGMGMQLFKTCTAFRNSILEYNDICVQQGLPSFLRIITDTTLDIFTLSPAQVQLGIVSLELALASLWQSWGLQPDIVIGHSLGEYPALCVAGVLSASDMLFLVGKRAELMDQNCTANTHAMLALQLPADSIRQRLSDGQYPSCEIACINGPNSSVASGEIEDIAKLNDYLQSSGVKTTLLEVPFAFHSQQMTPLLDGFEAIAQSVRFAKPNILVASTLLGAVIRDQGVFTANYLTRQARYPVNFLGALEACTAQQIIDNESLWVECGPSPSCLSLVRSTVGTSMDKVLPSLKRNEDCWMTISKSITNAYNNGVNIMWKDYEEEYIGALSLLELPSYAFDLENYWLQYEGDWSIKKGNLDPAHPSPTFLTPCLQQVEAETFGKDSASVTFVSHLAEAQLHALARGHKVNGHGLCPSSVYADMAFTAASYIHSHMKPSMSVPAMDVRDMEIFQPLIAMPDSQTQIVKVSAVRKPGADSVELSFNSQNNSESKEHARCTVQYGDGKAWMASWAKNANIISDRIDRLKDSVKIGRAHEVLWKMIYKLFQVVVNYDENYHALKEVAMDNDLHEAAANIKFQTPAADGKFVYSPYWIDSIAQLGGFVLNGSPTVLDDVVYLSHGWKSMRIVGPLSEKRMYRSYVHMKPTGVKGVFAGDVYLIDGEAIVAVCKGLKFQQMKRAILYSLLSAGISKPAQEEASLPFQTRAAKNHTTPALNNPNVPFSNILNTIASEIETDVSELVDDANLADLGVDSMLTISILNVLRPQTSLNLPSSLFSTYPTVAELRAFFGKDPATQGSLVSNSKTGDDASDDSCPPSASTRSSAVYTPPSEASDDIDIILSVLSSEIGIKKTEVKPSTLFTDLGVDSLLSISILSGIKEQTGRVLPSSFFNDYPTLADVQKKLGASLVLSSSQADSTKSIKTNSIKSEKLTNSVKSDSTNTAEPAESTSDFKCASVFLQGRPSSSKAALFLVPDGSGSARSYIDLPEFSSGILVYGLDSPFYTCPLDYTLSFEAVATLYVNEIRKLQPHGPYLIGGWSLGGIHAYEVSRQLLDEGEEIKGLFLIDSPCPGTLPPLPAPTFDILENAGIFAGMMKMGRKIPLATKQHFLASVNALEHWEHTRMAQDRKPGHVVVIWGKDGMWEGVSEENQKASMPKEGSEANTARDWLLGKRDDYGPSGWEKLTGVEVECHVVEGNHFSIMKHPKINAVGDIIMKAVENH